MRLAITLALVVGVSVGSIGCAVPPEDDRVAVAASGLNDEDLPDYGFTALTFGGDGVVVAALQDRRWAADTVTLVGQTTKGEIVRTILKRIAHDSVKGVARYVSGGGAPVADYNDVVAASVPTPSTKGGWLTPVQSTLRPTILIAIEDCYGRKPPTPPNCDPQATCVWYVPQYCLFY